MGCGASVVAYESISGETKLKGVLPAQPVLRARARDCVSSRRRLTVRRRLSVRAFTSALASLSSLNSAAYVSLTRSLRRDAHLLDRFEKDRGETEG